MAVTQYPAIAPTFDTPSQNQQFAMKAGETYKIGAFCKLTSGVAEEVAADPTSVWGLTLEPAALDPEGALLVLVAPLWQGQLFEISANAALTAANIGVAYAVVKESDGIWRADIGDTADTVVFVHAIDITRGRCICSLVAAVRQINPDVS